MRHDETIRGLLALSLASASAAGAASPGLLPQPLYQGKHAIVQVEMALSVGPRPRWATRLPHGLAVVDEQHHMYRFERLVPDRVAPALLGRPAKRFFPGTLDLARCHGAAFDAMARGVDGTIHAIDFNPGQDPGIRIVEVGRVPTATSMSEAASVGDGVLVLVGTEAGTVLGLRVADQAGSRDAVVASKFRALYGSNVGEGGGVAGWLDVATRGPRPLAAPSEASTVALSASTAAIRAGGEGRSRARSLLP